MSPVDRLITRWCNGFLLKKFVHIVPTPRCMDELALGLPCLARWDHLGEREI
jgi:hypothetical protein